MIVSISFFEVDRCLRHVEISHVADGMQNRLDTQSSAMGSSSQHENFEISDAIIPELYMPCTATICDTTKVKGP